MSSTDKPKERPTVISRGDNSVTITRNSGQFIATFRTGYGYSAGSQTETFFNFSLAVEFALKCLGHKDVHVVEAKSEVPA